MFEITDDVKRAHDHAYCNDTIVTRPSPAPWFGSKMQHVSTVRRHNRIRRLVSGSPHRSMGCLQLARRYVPLTWCSWKRFSMAEWWQNVCHIADLCNDAWRLITRSEYNVCFAFFLASRGSGIKTLSCNVDTWRHLWRHNSNELPSDVITVFSGRLLLQNFTLRDADLFHF